MRRRPSLPASAGSRTVRTHSANSTWRWSLLADDGTCRKRTPGPRKRRAILASTHCQRENARVSRRNSPDSWLGDAIDSRCNVLLSHIPPSAELDICTEMRSTFAGKFSASTCGVYRDLPRSRASPCLPSWKCDLIERFSGTSTQATVQRRFRETCAGRTRTLRLLRMSRNRSSPGLGGLIPCARYRARSRINTSYAPEPVTLQCCRTIF